MLCRILIFTEYIWLTERQRHNTHLRFWVEIDQGLSKTLEGQSRPGSLPGPLLIWICVWQQGTHNVQISDQLNAFEQRKSVWPIHFFFPRNACHDASVKYRTGGDCHNQLPEPWRKCTQPHGPTPWWKLSANQSVQHVSMLTVQRLHSTQPTVRIIAITRAIPDKQSYSKHSKLTTLLHHNIQVFLCSHCSSL